MLTQRSNQPFTSLLLCVLLISGCASEPKSISPDLREHLGKVYLNSAGSTGETFFHADFENDGIMGYTGKNAVDALDQCLGGALMGGALAPTILVICAPLNIAGSVMVGYTPNSTPKVSEETLAEMEKKTNDVLKNADLSPALVAAIDEQSQHNAYLAHYEISHGTLPLPENGESISELAAKWDYQTVIEVRVTEAGFESDAGQAALLHFAIAAEVKLIETKSGSVINRQEYRYDGTPQPYKFWFGDDTQKLPDEIKLANRMLANKILDKVFIK
jgi:hypothetical protein